MAKFKRSHGRDDELDLGLLLTTLVAFQRGDFSTRMPNDLAGVGGKIADTLNEIIDMAEITNDEYARVSQAIARTGMTGALLSGEGMLGARRNWVDSYNAMINNLSIPINEMMRVVNALAHGDLTQRVPTVINGQKKEGQFFIWAETINGMMSQLTEMIAEVTRVAREVGVEGKLGGQTKVLAAEGIWKELTDSVNSMAITRTSQLRDVSKVATALAKGDLEQRMTVDAQGEVLQIKNLINAMMDQLSTFASEVTRVAREFGTDGKLGGQVAVLGASGTWKDLTDNVNLMSSSLTSQVRAIAEVTAAVANGDLSQKITADARGEFLQIKDTINNKIDHLNTFADEVTRVAREVGTEGILGGQARVPGVSGIWKDLTDNVNVVVANLTIQVRGIAKVVAAVAKGDSEGALNAFVNIAGPATASSRGEVGDLKENLNEMIGKLRVSTSQRLEDDWLKANLANFSRLLQGQRELTAASDMILSELAPLVNAQHGVFYLMSESANGDSLRLKMLSSYAYAEQAKISREWKIGQGLVGQCAFEKKRILLTDVPEDYVHITSGLGEAKPLNIVVVPIMFEGKVNAVIELASFTQFTSTQIVFLDQLAESIGIVVNTIEISMRTEELLQQSQTLAEELQSQQEELRQTNEELQEKAQLLEEQKLEMLQAKTAVEEKASQLELTSKYKSEFLSNMSHELRTPLNSLLILAEQLAENPKSHLDPKEVEFAKLIHVSGNDLLSLINEILDLSKIESGTVLVDNVTVPFVSLQDQIESIFRHVADDRGLGFEITLARELPPVIVTDEMRLLQVLKNLLSNSFKFTERGQVSVRADRVTSGWSAENKSLSEADEVFAFTVEDTGIGISADKQRIIFEAFQQGDGRTARKYGGTGLGLSISREIARLLGGELVLGRSIPQQGSTFVLYVPQSRISGANSAPTLRLGQRSNPRDEDHAAESGISGRGSRAILKSEVADDRDLIEGDRVLLIIEDDPIFAKILLDLAREKGFKGIIAARGARALELARSHKPDAITLDIHIPDVDGWTILDTLKRDPDLRHIPVDVITVEDYPLRALSQGAFQYLNKPVSQVQLAAVMETTRKFLDRSVKNLLLVVDNKDEERQITELLGEGDISVTHAISGKAGLAEMSKKSFDCVVVGARLSDMSGADFITAMRKDELLGKIPVVVFSGESITNRQRNELEELGAASVVRSVDSLDRLLDQTALFLHRVVSRLPKEKRNLLHQLQYATNILGGKKVLIVDDDARNIFALTAALERKGLVVLSADNGRLAIDILKETLDMDLVLMDIMMPEMDGYETMRQIRKEAKFKKLPIIALTAKAMVGDREKCLEAGASDYLSKPVNVEQLASLMQVWLSK